MWCLIVTLVALLLVAWPIILSGNTSGRGAYDDLTYHWPAIQTFAEQLPTPDLSDYASATTPGYHLELSILHRLGASRTFVQLYASLWTALLFAILAWRAGRAFGKPGVLLTLPFLCSIYVLFPSIWLLPDNAGWLGVLVILILALDYPSTTRNLLIAGITLALLVLVRQVHIWSAAIIVIGAWTASTDDARYNPKSPSEQTRHLVTAILATIPAFLLLLYFLRLWGGLVPPTFQANHQGPNPATPAFILTQISILSVFFAPILFPRLLELLKAHKAAIILTLLLGLAIGLVPETSFNREAGRFSGWWNIVRAVPSFADRSPVIILGSTAGALATVIWLSLVSKREAQILLITLLAFTAAQTANHASWQRYHEPMLLMLGLLILTRSQITRDAPKRVLVGAAILSAMLAAITVPTILKADPITPDPTNTDQTPSASAQFTPKSPQIQ
jgi:hypothetical protein